MNILCTAPFEERHKKLVEAAAVGCRVKFRSNDAVEKADADEADIIIGNIPPRLLDASPRLRLLQLVSAGADGYTLPGVLHPDTVLANATGAYSKTVSEHALALTLSLLKKLYLYRDGQNRAEWRDRGAVGSLADSTVLVVGLGDIGRSYARLVKSLGAYVIGVKRRASDRPDCVDELYLTEDILKALPRADVVFSILPGTAATACFYTEEMFAAMKPEALFINCGRGNAVASELLYRVLSEGRIQAAAIDVAETEPLPGDSPLWALENLVITPHVSGGFHIPDTLDEVARIAAGNIGAVLEGRPVRNAVDLSTGYKR